MLRNRVFYVLLLIVMAMIYIFTNTYYTLMLLGLCVVLPLVSLMLMMLSRRGLSISLEVPQTAEKRTAGLTYTFVNSSRFPAARVTFAVTLENQMTGAVRERKVNVSVGGKKTVTANLALENSKVGTVVVNTYRIRLYDAFGIFTVRKPDLDDQMMIIYPNMKDITVQMEKPIETGGDGTRFSPDRPGQDVSEIFALREYAAGDEIRKIHWKLSSKIDRTMVRDFSLPLNYSVFLLAELNQGSEEMVDAQVEICLGLSRALLENGIIHNLGWYDSGQGVFHVKELNGFEELELASAEMLSSYAAGGTSIALDFYAAGGYRGQNNILLYVVTDSDIDKIAELEVSQRMQTILIYEDKAIADAAEQAIDVMAVSIKEAAEGLPEIIV